MNIEEYIQAQQLSTYCVICKADLQGPHNAQSHYSCKRHNQKVKTFRSEYLQLLKEKQKNLEKRTASCDICIVQFPESEAAEHYTGDEHKRKEETYCKTCKITASTKNHLWEHLQGAKHRNKTVELGLPSEEVQYGPFDSTLPRELKKEMLAELCKLCNAKLPTMQHAFEHYRTSKHSAKVRNWFKVQKEKREISKSLTSSTQSLESNTTKKKDLKAVTSISPSRPSHFKCFVCKLDVQEDSGVSDHKTSFPHVELATLKSNLVSTGILEEYWVRQGTNIVCAICNVLISSPDVAKSHFNSRGHSLNFQDWSILSFKGTKVLSESETKWFYCRICSVPLDGTSDAEKHYLAPGHIKRSQLFCKACDVLNPSEEELMKHRCSALHLENLKRPRDTTDNSETGSYWRPMPLWTFAKENLREQGHMGTVQTIYSTPVAQTNSVNKMPNKPTSTSSVETKKETANEEIKIKNEKPNKTVENEKENGDRDNPLTIEETENKAALKNQIMEEIQKMVQNLYWSKTVPHQVALEYLRKVNKEVEELKKKYEKNTGEEMSAQHENGLSDSEILSAEEEFHSLNSSQFLEENQQNSSNSTSNTSNDLDTYFERAYSINGPISSKDATEKSFYENLISDISDKPDEGQPLEPIASTSQKLDETKQNGLPVDESENLETMLQQIVVLKNQVDDHLERDVLTEIEKLINLVNSDCVPPDETLKCLQYFNRKLEVEELIKQQDQEGAKNDVVEAKPEIKYRYSKEDLYSLRTEKTFLESFSSQQRAAISRKGMWNKKKMDQMASEGCTSLYDYFSDNDFVKFVETYLQGSLNNLSLQNSE